MDDKKTRVPVTGSEPNGEVSWCITHGWGDLNGMKTPFTRADSFEDAVQAIASYARRNYPNSINDVWTYSFTEDGQGVVCDWGNWVYFGFIRGKCAIQSQAPDVPLDPPGRPEKECSAADYLESDDGIKLKRMFDRYFGDDLPGRLSWWQSHALEYCIVSEWWSMFMYEDPSIGEIWEHDLSPNDVYEHVLRWARGDPDGAEILLQSSPDARWDAFHSAFTWGEE